MLALLAHQMSTATLREIADTLGLAGRDSVHKIIKRAESVKNEETQRRIKAIQETLDERSRTT